VQCLGAKTVDWSVVRILRLGGILPLVSTSLFERFYNLSTQIIASDTDNFEISLLEKIHKFHVLHILNFAYIYTSHH
jgi:hypothetical protein